MAGRKEPRLALDRGDESSGFAGSKTTDKVEKGSTPRGGDTAIHVHTDLIHDRDEDTLKKSLEKEKGEKNRKHEKKDGERNMKGTEKRKRPSRERRETSKLMRKLKTGPSLERREKIRLG